MFSAEVKIDLSPIANLKQSLIKKILKKAVTQASRIVREAAKNNAENVRRFGYLAKSIGIKVKVYKGVAIAVIGPRSQWKRNNGTYKKGKKKGHDKLIRPSFYEHFLERPAKRLKQKPVLAPALASTGKQYTDLLCQLIKQGIEDALKKQ